MTEMIEALAKYGHWLLFASVLGRQACLPVLANLLLVAAGALAGFGRLSEAGQRWGSRTLHFTCGATHGRESRADQVTPTFSRHVDDDQLLGRAQEPILRNDDTHPLFLQHCPLEEVAQAIRRIRLQACSAN